MKDTTDIELLTHPRSGSPASLEDVLDTIHERPDAHCRWAYDFFDDRMDGHTMEIINRMAGTGLGTRRIFEIYIRNLPAEACAWPDRMHEMVILEIEWAVRKATT